MTTRKPPSAGKLVTFVASRLKERAEEVNRLNVFPVPDGDTGTNMSLTLDAVLAEVRKLPDGAGRAEACKAITSGSLMGARGNSGVILSQVLRGLCDVIGTAEIVDGHTVAEAMKRSKQVAYQAVRKPVEGTMLTVLRESADAAVKAAEDGGDLFTVVEALVEESYASVRRTPELLAVLKESGVVDAGGFGLAIVAEAVGEALEGRSLGSIDTSIESTPLVATVPEDDWSDEEYLYCTEFLLHGKGLDRGLVQTRVSASGGSELVVGDASLIKVHVHTDDPASIIAFATGLGQVSEVHINNMRLQTAARAEEIRADSELLPVGFVAVAAGDGLSRILTSLGAHRIVSGGQTMNPSTAELLEAADSVNASAVVILPDNRNIIMAAQQVIGLAQRPVFVVPTTSVPEAFSALLAYSPDADVEANVEAMSRAAGGVRTGEVTRAVKDAKWRDGDVKAGQVIGISDHEIEVVGEDVAEVATRLLDILANGGETLTLLAGEDLTDPELADLETRMRQAHPELEVESHRGEQPLYPLIMAIE